MAYTSCAATPPPNDGVLEFEKAMNDFQEMFPTVRREEIECVLRKNDGDVAATIDDLLTMTSMKEQPKNSPPRVLRETTYCTRPATSSTSARRSTRSARLSVDDVCRETAIIRDKMSENERRLDRVCDEREARILEDEQIALMLQNREFIGYLKRDPQFLREVFGRDIDRNVIHIPRKNVRQTAQNAPTVPNGPVIVRDHVPEGPIVEGMISMQKPGVLETMRRKISSSKNHSYTASYQDTPSGSEVVTQNEFGDGVPAYPYTVEAPPLPEKDIKEKLKTMSKSSKAKLSSMANLFRKNHTRGLDDPLPGY